MLFVSLVSASSAHTSSALKSQAASQHCIGAHNRHSVMLWYYILCTQISKNMHDIIKLIFTADLGMESHSEYHMQDYNGNNHRHHHRIVASTAITLSCCRRRRKSGAKVVGRMKGISENLFRMIILCSTFPALDSQRDTIAAQVARAQISKENVSSLDRQKTLAHSK